MSKTKQTAKKTLPEPPSTMEVPKVMKVQIRDGLLLNKNERSGLMSMLFLHCQKSMNGRNDMGLMKGLAEVHGVTVEEVDE